MKRIVTLTLTVMLLLCVTTAQATISTTGLVTPADPSSWDAATTATVGTTAAGSLTINGGDDVVALNFFAGQNAGVTGTVNVSGTSSDPTSSSLTVTGGNNFVIGWVGDGTLNVDGNAEVTASAAAVLWAWQPGSTSTVSITNGGTVRMNGIGNNQIGSRGKCDIQIGNDGGTALSTLEFTGNHLDFGRIDGTPGTDIKIWANGLLDSSTIEGNIAYGAAPSSMVITGGTWLVKDAVVGRHALGTLLVEAGGKVESETGILSEFSNGESLTTITGEGSLWDCSGVLSVGMDAAGALNILSGGELKVGTLCIDYDMVLPDEGTVGVADSNVRVGNLGMLTISGQHDANMAAFLDAIVGSSERLMILDQSYTWVDAASATPGLDYTLTYDSVADATTLTAMASIPEPSTLILLLGVALAGWFLRKK